MKKENVSYVIMAILVVIIILFVTGTFKNCSGPEKKSPNSSSTSVVTTNPGGISAADLRMADSLQTALNECLNISVKPKTIKEHIANLQKALNKCTGYLTVEEQLKIIREQLSLLPKNRGGGGGGNGVRRKPNTTVVDVPEEKFTGNFNQSGSGSGSGSGGDYSKTISSGTNVNSAVNLSFLGNIPKNSLQGTVCDGDKEIVFYIKDFYWQEIKKSFKASFMAPKLYTENGPDFTLDPQSGNWFYIKPGSVLDPSMVNDWDKREYWGFCIGKLDGYWAFGQHETIKADIQAVRGRLDGPITMGELREMSKRNPLIWSDTNPNGIYVALSQSPNRVNPVVGSDGLSYEGFSIATPVMCEVKTETVSSGNR